MSLRDLPSVDQLLTQAEALLAAYGRPLTTDVLREGLETARESIRAGAAAPPLTDLLQQARARLAAITAPSLRPVINASGVILHTNLGRAPLSAAALGRLQAVAQGYSTLEYDLAKGEPATRALHAAFLG